jgi:chromosome segregation ATPase
MLYYLYNGEQKLKLIICSFFRSFSLKSAALGRFTVQVVSLKTEGEQGKANVAALQTSFNKLKDSVDALNVTVNELSSQENTTNQRLLSLKTLIERTHSARDLRTNSTEQPTGTASDTPGGSIHSDISERLNYVEAITRRNGKKLVNTIH